MRKLTGKDNKKAKILIAVIACIAGTAIVLIAVAAILSSIAHIDFAAALRNKYTYIIGSAVVIIGVLVVCIDLRVRGSKRVLKVNIDLEDSHFMTRKEIARNKGFICSQLSELANVTDGIPLLAEKKGDDIEVVMHDPIHTIVIGATGTGKTAGFVSPAIEILSRTKTKPSIVVTDPKGELFTRHKKTLTEQGYNVTLIDLSDVYHSTHWNPLNDVYRKTERMTYTIDQRNGKYYYGGRTYLTNAEAEQARAERIVQLKDEIYIDLQDLIYTAFPVENKHDMTWQRGARDLIFALALAFWEDMRDGYLPKEKFNLYNLYRTVTDYAKGNCEDLIRYFATRDETSRARGLSNTVLVSEDRTLSSYLGDVNQYMNWLADGGIAALTSENDVEFSSFDEAANVLFIKIPDEKENRHKLVSLMLTQMYKALVEKADNNREANLTKDQKLLKNVYFIMDEFGNIPKIEKMQSIITVGRSRGIFAIPIIQDFNQLDTIYGKEVAATIRNNCNIQIFIGTNDENTRRLFSEACGKKKTKQVSYSENKDMSVSTSAQSVPLIYPTELEKLNDPVNGIIGNSIALCIGKYPIKGITTPVFKATDIYKTENTTEKLQAFTFFDETKSHYDIAHITKFLEDDTMLNFVNKIDDFNNEQTEENAEQAEQAKPVEMAVIKEIAKLESESKKRLMKSFSVLQSKLKEKEFIELTQALPDKQIDMLDELANGAADRGNLILAAEIENIRSQCVYLREDIK